MKTSNRLLILVGGAAGACAIAVPLVLGLSGNPSFSERIPVRAPSSAHLVEFDGHGNLVDDGSSTTPGGPTTSAGPRGPTAHPRRTPGRVQRPAPRDREPGDDRGTTPTGDGAQQPSHGTAGSRSTEPGDGRGTHTEPGDDRGTHSEPGDDRTATATPTDDGTSSDHGGRHGSGGGPGGGAPSSSPAVAAPAAARAAAGPARTVLHDSWPASSTRRAPSTPPVPAGLAGAHRARDADQPSRAPRLRTALLQVGAGRRRRHRAGRARRRPDQPPNRGEPVGARGRPAHQRARRQRRAAGAHRRDGDQHHGRGQAGPDRAPPGAVGLAGPGQDLDAAGRDRLLRRAAAGRRHVRSRRRRPRRAVQPAGARRDHRPRRAREPLRARTGHACSRSTGRCGRRAASRCCSRPTSATTRSASAPSQLWRGFAGITLSSIAAIVVLLVPLVWTLVARARRAHQQREAMLQRAMDASLDERRRIAATLHDGVVQELAAASFAVAGSAQDAAATRRCTSSPQRLRAAGRRGAHQHRRHALAAGRHLPAEPARGRAGAGAARPRRHRRAPSDAVRRPRTRRSA